MLLRRTSLALALLTLFTALPAFAQATRTWVSGVGDDVNPCSRTAPCKTLSGAISKTASAGEIDILDPAGVGAVTITKSITIDGLNQGSVLVSGTNGVVVNDSTGNDTIVVTLRNLALIGVAGNAHNGVSVLHAKAVHVEHCTVSGFNRGIASTTAPVALYLRDTVITESTATVAGSANAGLSLNQGSAVVESSQISTSSVGVGAEGTAKVTLRDSTIAGNATAGVSAIDSAEVNLEHVAVSANGVGVTATSPAVVRLSEVMVSDNTTGVSGNVVSFQNNRVAAGNGTDGAPSSTLPLQ